MRRNPGSCRVGVSLLVGVGVVCASPVRAHAADGIGFSQRGAESGVSGSPGDPFHLSGPERLEVLRGGVAVGTLQQSIDWGVVIAMPELLPGDQARYYHGSALILAATYDGLPAVTGACAGATSFRVAMGTLVPAGVRSGVIGSTANPTAPSTTDPDVVTVTRPLAVGDYVEASGYRLVGAARVDQQTDLIVADCPPAPVPTAGPAVPQPTALSIARVQRARTGVRVTLSVPEPGTLRVRLTYRGKAVAIAQRTSVGTLHVPLTVSRRMRSHRLTVSATFTPSRAGASLQTAKRVLKQAR